MTLTEAIPMSTPKIALKTAETVPVAEPSDRTKPARRDRGKRMVDLAAGDCRFPVGPPGLGAAGRARRFCGHPARQGGPYCEAHHAVAYLAPPDEDDGQAGADAKEAQR